MQDDKQSNINVGQIQAAIRAAGASWEAGVTSVSDLSPDEQRIRLGVPPPPGGFESMLRQAEAFRAAAAATAANLPAAYDLRNIGGKNFITPIRDQGACGSCVAFGTCATIEGMFRVQRGDPTLNVDLSEAHLFFCQGRAQGVTCATGWMPDKAFACAAATGIADEACYPYDTNKTDCSGLCSDWQNRVTKVTAPHGIAPGDIKTAITTKGPVSACFVVYDDFFSYRSGVYRHVTGNQAGGHCISLVGYDDAAQCWIAKNSWGTGWGENGFFRIAYGECGIDTWAVYAADSVAETAWLNNRQVVGLWTIDQDRNAWAYLDGNIGWRRIAFDNDNIFFDMLAQLSAAKLAHRPVNVYQELGVIKQAYVL
jgi:C1A family cysteine protease